MNKVQDIQPIMQNIKFRCYLQTKYDKLLQNVTNVTNCYKIWQIVTKCDKLLQNVTNCYKMWQKWVTLTSGKCYKLLQNVTKCDHMWL